MVAVPATLAVRGKLLRFTEFGDTVRIEPASTLMLELATIRLIGPVSVLLPLTLSRPPVALAAPVLAFSLIGTGRAMLPCTWRVALGATVTPPPIAPPFG